MADERCGVAGELYDDVPLLKTGATCIGSTHVIHASNSLQPKKVHEWQLLLMLPQPWTFLVICFYHYTTKFLFLQGHISILKITEYHLFY